MKKEDLDSPPHNSRVSKTPRIETQKQTLLLIARETGVIGNFSSHQLPIFSISLSLSVPFSSSPIDIHEHTPNMSGRSAHVRKKKSDTKSSSSSRRPSTATTGSLHETSSTDSTVPGYDRGLASPIPVGTGIGTTNARFLRFADSSVDVSYDGSGSSCSPGYVGGGGGSDYYSSRRATQMTMSSDGQYSPGGGGDWYGKALRTEGVSGIEKSGLRSVIDRKSDGVRKGIAKTFSLGKKHKEEKGKAPEKDHRRGSGSSSQSQQETFYIEHDDYEDGAEDPGPYRGGGGMADQSVYGSPRSQHGPTPHPYPPPPHHTQPRQFAGDGWDAITPITPPGIPFPSLPPSRELPPLPPHARPQQR